MRETRTAPTSHAPGIRLRKSTNIVDVIPRAEDYVDPLGLGYVHHTHLSIGFLYTDVNDALYFDELCMVK